MQHHKDELGHTEERLKSLINREYAIHFKKEAVREGYVRELNIYSD